MTTNPKDQLELLEVFRLALTNGVLDKTVVVQWADDIIKHDLEPDYFIVEMSLSGRSVNDLISLLKEYIGEGKPQVSGRVILGLIYNQYITGEITLGKAIGQVYRLVWEADLTDEEKGIIYSLDDEMLLAEEGIYGTFEDAETQALRFFEVYKDFRIDNFHEWKTINAALDSKFEKFSEVAKEDHEALVIVQDGQPKRKWWKLW